MQVLNPNVIMEQTANIIVMGARYQMQDGRLGQVTGVRRLLDGSMFLIMQVQDEPTFEVSVREFDSWQVA